MTDSPGRSAERYPCPNGRLFAETDLLELPPEARRELHALGRLLALCTRRLLPARPRPVSGPEALAALAADVVQLRAVARVWADADSGGHPWEAPIRASAERLDELARDLVAALSEPGVAE